MDLRQLTYFLGVVTHGGFGRAAEHLHVSQPALSQAVAALERDLGTPLFHRVPRGVTLTDAGEVLVPLARQVLRDLDVARDATRSVGEELTGTVEIAVLPSQSVEPFTSMMRAVADAHPGLTVNAHAAFGRDEAVALLRSGVCELALVGALAAPYAPGLAVRSLGHQEIVLIAPPDSDLPTDRLLTARDLDGQRLIGSPAGSVMRRMADELLAGSTMRMVVQAEHRSAVLPLVLAGVGVAVLSSAWEPLARRAGATVCTLEDPLRLDVDLVSRTARLTPAAEAFVDVAMSIHS